MTLTEDRVRARQLATTIVSVAIAVAGLMLVAFAVALVVRGGAGYLFLSIILGVLGLALGAIGFFFQLVPFRLEELAEEKRDYDRRARGPP